MAESYESFYDGGPDSFEPVGDPYAIGFKMGASQIGFPGSAQTANQLGEVVNAAKQGVKAFEVTLGVPDTADTIPIQHFKEMKALMKLTGVKPSVHGPFIDAAGFGERGWGGEYEREDNERRMFNAIEKAHILDPKGNIPVVFHSTNGTPGSEFRPDENVKPGEKGRIKEYALGVVNKESGQVTQAKEHRSYFLSTSEKEFKLGEKDLEKGGTLMTAPDAIHNQNAIEWDERLKGVVADKSRVDRALSGLFDTAKAINLLNTNDQKELDEGLKQNPLIGAELLKTRILLDNNNQSFRALFDKAYKYGSDVQREHLRELAKNWQEENEKMGDANPFRQQMNISHLQDKYFNMFREITTPKVVRGEDGQPVKLEGFDAPEIYQKVEDFARDKAAMTFSNLASKSYDKYGKSAPIIAIENMLPGMAFSNADDLKKLVEESRKNFEGYLVKNKNLSEKEAKKVAEKHIGVTWDVGHLNVMRKKGFNEQDVIEESKKIASMVKHVHLTDNFGYNDSHLAPGMGNVPIKKILEELEKKGDLASMRKIVEAPNFVQHFKQSPHSITMAAFGSPIYGMKAGPSWNQARGMMASYFGGYGTLNPDIHHSMYGAGFTAIPPELGGSMPGGQSRFGGTPMA